MRREVEVGARGRAVGPLRPAGRIRIGEATIEARSESTWIDADAEIVVVGSSSFGPVVKLLSEAGAEPAESQGRAIFNGKVAECIPLAAPPTLVERINSVVWGAVVGCLLVPAAWLAGQPLSLAALAPPVAGVVAGALFQWLVRGAAAFTGPRADHRRLAQLIAALACLGGAVSAAVGLSGDFGFLAIAAGLVLGTLVGGLLAWGGAIVMS